MAIPPLENVELPPFLENIIDFPRFMQKVSSTFYVLKADYLEQEKSARTSENLVEESSEGPRLCSICCSAEPDAIFQNCGHSGMCFACACEMWKKTKKCYICRTAIDIILKYATGPEDTVEIKRAVRYHIEI